MPEPSCMVRLWAMSDPRNTRLDTSERYSSFFRNSESKSAMMFRRRSGLFLVPRRSLGTRALRHRDRFLGGFEGVGHHRIRRDAVGLALEVEDQPVPQRHRGDRLDVVPGDVIAA